MDKMGYTLEYYLALKKVILTYATPQVTLTRGQCLKEASRDKLPTV